MSCSLRMLVPGDRHRNSAVNPILFQNIGGSGGELVGQWEALSARMEAVRARLSPDRRDSYLELVEHPIAAMTNLYRLYYAVAWNRRLAAAGSGRPRRGLRSWPRLSPRLSM